MNPSTRISAASYRVTPIVSPRATGELLAGEVEDACFAMSHDDRLPSAERDNYRRAGSALDGYFDTVCAGDRDELVNDVLAELLVNVRHACDAAGVAWDDALDDAGLIYRDSLAGDCESDF